MWGMEPLLLLFALMLLQKDGDRKSSLDQFLKFYRENRDLIAAVFSMQPSQREAPPQPCGAQPTKDSRPLPQGGPSCPDAPPAAQAKRPAPPRAEEKAVQTAPPDVRILEEYLRRASR